MIDIFIDLVTAAMSIGSITDAHMYSQDLITIGGKTKAGKEFTVTFRHIEGTEDVTGENS